MKLSRITLHLINFINFIMLSNIYYNKETDKVKNSNI
jgi:hypothetical protein